jgi:putative ABC transport system permease protein
MSIKKWFGFLSTVWLGLVTHKLRSFLTILGVVIGVASVIVLMSIGQGSTKQILENIQSMGANLISIRPGSFTFGGIRGGMSQTLTMEDATAIEAQVPDIAAVAPSYTSNLQLVAGSKNTNSQVNGTTPEYMAVNNLAMSQGAFFSQSEYDGATKVAVLGSNVATELFSDNDPVGQQMRMGHIIVTVIGVLESKGSTFNSPDDAVYIPLTVMQQAVAQPRTPQGGRIVSAISLTVSNETYTQSVIDNITSLLRTRHQLSATANDDFNIMSTEEIANTLTQTTSTLTLLLGAVAAISLLVGGIGVMNIMLVSVLERTREIGIRKALGARNQDIWSQFLVEAALLTFTGGIIGVILGWGLSILVNFMGWMTTVVSVDIVFLAVGVAIAIGLFFGFYPAWNASRLNPIEALRSE